MAANDATAAERRAGGHALSSGSILNYRFGQANVPGGPLNDLTNVGGNLALAGTLNVTEPSGASFGPGLYRIFNYAGALSDGGLALGSTPAGSGPFVAIEKDFSWSRLRAAVLAPDGTCQSQSPWCALHQRRLA